MSNTGNRTIYVQIVIDTDRLLQSISKRETSLGSTHRDNPTKIKHNFEYMVVSDNVAVSGQGGADLKFKASVGDTVRFFGSSSSANFDDAILVYGIEEFGGTNTVLTNLTSIPFEREGVTPSGTSTLKFWFFEGTVVKSGTEKYQVKFALHTRTENGSFDPVVRYYEWDPTIIVHG